jgi:hypothetical protein
LIEDVVIVGIVTGVVGGNPLELVYVVVVVVGCGTLVVVVLLTVVVV